MYFLSENIPILNKGLLIEYFLVIIIKILEINKLSQVRKNPCCALKPSKYKYEIDYDQIENNYEDNINKLKFLADNLVEEIKVIVV